MGKSMTLLEALVRMQELLWEDDDIVSQENLAETQNLCGLLIDTIEFNQMKNHPKLLEILKKLQDLLWEDDDMMSQKNLYKAQYICDKLVECTAAAATK